jgi:thiol-disulfide isomerase/thioredoxin
MKHEIVSHFVGAENQQINHSVTVVTTPKNKKEGEKHMSQIIKDKLLNNAQELNSLLKTSKKIFVLFYASWCPHSLRFLPLFQQYAQKTKNGCYRIIIDEDEDLCSKYSIEVYPTVLFFENGTVKKRLDGTPGVGLYEQQLQELLNTCDTS